MPIAEPLAALDLFMAAEAQVVAAFFVAILAPIPAPLRVTLEVLMFFVNYACDWRRSRPRRG
jgi:hypothetical protein